ncbi:hypothetical protein B0H14DRAFT_2588423 [Mycena olivaceomarginata]|nr:hypothetical protein B0H14DRAFT_2588423 [Mycena olivaceomarginata]
MPRDPAVQLANINGGEAVSVGEGRSLDDRSKSPPPSPSAQQQAAQLAALLNFRPSSRDVISAVRVSPFALSATPPDIELGASASLCVSRPAQKPAAPVRCDIAFLNQHIEGEESVVLEVYTTPSRTSAPLPPIVTPTPASSENQNNVKKPKPRGSFRIDRVLKTFVLRLK